MKKYFIIISIFIIFLPLTLSAEVSCDFPSTIREDLPFVDSIKREFFKHRGILVFIYHYNITNPKYRNPKTNFHFKNIIKLAEKEWGKKDFNLDDYWDKNGRAIPYILIELGGTINGNNFYPIDKYARIGTCYDRQLDNVSNIYFFKSEGYQQLIESVKTTFYPALVIEDMMEKDN